MFNEETVRATARYENGEKHRGYRGLGKVAMALRHEAPKQRGRMEPWLADDRAHRLQQEPKYLELAYWNFLAARAAFPRFKKMGERDCFCYPDLKEIKLDQGNGRLVMPKLGWMGRRAQRKVLRAVRNETVCLWGWRWFAQIKTEREGEQQVPHGPSVVGTNLSVAGLARFTAWTFRALLNCLQKHEARLRCYQRELRRKLMVRSYWKMAMARVSRRESSMGIARRAFLHMATPAIGPNQELVGIDESALRIMCIRLETAPSGPGRMFGQRPD